MKITIEDIVNTTADRLTQHRRASPTPISHCPCGGLSIGLRDSVPCCARCAAIEQGVERHNIWRENLREAQMRRWEEEQREKSDVGGVAVVGCGGL